MAVVYGEYGPYDNGSAAPASTSYITRGDYRLPNQGLGGTRMGGGQLEFKDANGNWIPVTAENAPAGYDPRQDSNAQGSNERLRFDQAFTNAPADVPIGGMQDWAMANGWTEPDRSNNEGTLGSALQSIIPGMLAVYGGVNALGAMSSLGWGGTAGLDAASLAAGDSMAGMIPGSELGAWTGAEAGAGDWANLGDLWNYGGGEATGSWTDSLSKMFSEMGFGNGPSTAARVGSTVAGAGGDKSGFGWGDVKSALSLATPIMSIASGLYGMSEADKLKKAAMLAGQQADPWGTSGGRSLADSQLQELMRNPGQVALRDPSYALRIQGAQRAMAQYGQDSGAMSVAGANASTDWYNQRLGQLGGLAGAGVNPGNASQISMSGLTSGNDLMSKALASIGYGVTRAGGGAGMPPEVQQWLRSQGML